MSTTQISSEASENASVKNVDMKLEVVTIPVSDIDRKTGILRWSRMASGRHSAGLWHCSVNAAGLRLLVQFGTNRTSAEPGLPPEHVPDRHRHPGCL